MVRTLALYQPAGWKLAVEISALFCENLVDDWIFLPAARAIRAPVALATACPCVAATNAMTSSDTARYRFIHVPREHCTTMVRNSRPLNSSLA